MYIQLCVLCRLCACSDASAQLGACPAAHWASEHSTWPPCGNNWLLSPRCLPYWNIPSQKQTFIYFKFRDFEILPIFSIFSSLLGIAWTVTHMAIRVHVMKQFEVQRCPWVDTSILWCIIQYVLVGAKWPGCINAGTLCFLYDSSRGPGVPENSYRDTSFRDVPSPHSSQAGRCRL